MIAVLAALGVGGILGGDVKAPFLIGSAWRSRLLACAAVIVAAAAAGAAPRPEARPALAAASRAAPAGVHLLLTSNRDGDYDVYGVGVAGLRMAALTRNSVRDGDVVTSERTGWFALTRAFGDGVLVSPDGRHERRLRGLEPLELSADGRLLALDGANLDEPPRDYVLAVPRGRPRSLGRGWYRGFSPNGRLIALDTSSRLGLVVVNVASGKRTSLRGTATAEYGLAWSLESTRLALAHSESHGSEDVEIVSVVDVRRPRVPPHRLLAASRINAQWLPGGRLAYDLERYRNGRYAYELGTLNPVSGARHVIARAPSHLSGTWSPDGRRVAYGLGEDSKLVLASTTGSARRVLMRHAWASAWSPDSRRLAFVADDPSSTFILQPGGGISKVPGGGSPVVWSPDGRRLVLEIGTTIAITGPGGRGLQRVPLGGGAIRVVGWAAAPLSATAPRVAPLPVIESAAKSQLRARGTIPEIASDGPWAAAIVETTRFDREHVVVWNEATGRLVRFAERSPPDMEDRVTYFDLALKGYSVTWKVFSCGNFCYVSEHTADVRRPFHEEGTEDEETEDSPKRPPPPVETRNGVTVSVTRGTIVLTRADGRTQAIHPPGGAVDAELENEGLFYTYRPQGSFPGRVAFVPFAQLFPN